MLSLAGANEIIVSATTKALASASELRLVDLGDRELRGLPDSYRLYRLDAR
jgi:class 3 adenylate cyclase